MVHFLLQVTCLLPCRGRKLDQRRSRRRRKCCNPYRGLNPPKPRQQYGCNFHQGVPRQTSLFLLKRPRYRRKGKEKRLRIIRRCQVVLAQLSPALEKARKSALREMSIRTFLSGNWKGTDISAERDAKSHVSPLKLEKFRLDRYRAVDRYWGVESYSESKLEPLTAV